MIVKVIVRNVIIIFSIVLCFSCTLFAQPNYMNGYIISNNNDTTYGEIDYQEWIQTPDSIFFREKDWEEKQLFKPSDILEFYVLGEVYSSELVTIDVNLQKAKLGTRNPAGFKKPIKKRVFIQNLVKGDALSLFLYKKSRDNFYVKEDTSYIELISHEYIIKNNDQYFVASKNEDKYVQQLKNLSNECGSLIENDKVHYTTKSLMDFTIKCNDFLEVKKSYFYTLPKAVIDHGIVLGTGINSFKAPLFEAKIDYRSMSYFSFGYSVDITPPRGRKKRKISTQLMFSHFKSKNAQSHEATFFGGNCNEPESDCQVIFVQSIDEPAIALSFLKLNIVYSNKFNARDFSPTFLLGGSFGGTIYSRTNNQIETKIYHEENGSRTLESVITEEDDVYKPTDFTLNIFGGIGLSYKKHSLSFMFEPRLMKNNIVPYQSFYMNLKIGVL